MLWDAEPKRSGLNSIHFPLKVNPAVKTVSSPTRAVAGTEEKDLKQFLLQTLPAWQVPREWWFVDSLDSNRRGKIFPFAVAAKILRRKKFTVDCQPRQALNCM